MSKMNDSIHLATDVSSQSPQSASGKPRFLPALLGLRGIAAVSIIFFHLIGLVEGLEIPDGFNFIRTHFGMGVPLFFVLSSFSLFYTTFSAIHDDQWLLKFLIKRITRIAPLFYFMLLVWYLFFASHGVTWSLAQLALNISFAFNLAPSTYQSYVPAGWTIGVEMLFYSILPLLLVAIRSLYKSLLFVVFAIIVGLGNKATLSLSDLDIPEYASHSFLSQLPIFAIGIFAYFIWSKYYKNEYLLPLSAGAVILTFLFQILFPSLSHVLLWSFMFGGLIVFQAIKPSHLLSNRLLLRLGELSYSIYLTHVFVIVILKEQILIVYDYFFSSLGSYSFFVVACSIILLVFFLSCLTFQFIEKPGLNLGRRLIKKYCAPLSDMSTHA